LDYTVFTAYMIGVCAIGVITAAKVRNSADLFAAGRQAPWWMAGLSSYMTMFSAATFVVWGGIAYRYGIVAVVINLTYGVAALLVGYFVAARWRQLGVLTAAEFVELRFGKAALAVFTALNLVAKMLAVGAGLYSLAVIICALVPLDAGNVMQDPATGHLSLTWTVVMLGTMVVVFTAAGGLWAVLVTDVVQFVIIMIAVSLVAPLIIARAGGLQNFAASAPAGFFRPTGGNWNWWIIAGWCAIQFTMIGAEWAFVQRYLCVSSQRSARKVAYLFGALYLVSPLLWMLPPMVYRTINPQADPEQAYILACQAVLPAGAIGLMLAAMAAATLSGIDSQLNVFAGVLTNDFYKPFLRPRAADSEIVRVGRMLTTVLGAVLIGLALLAPRWGGVENVIIKVTSLYVGPLLLPTIWGLFSRKLTSSAMWATVAASAIGATIVFLLQASTSAAQAEGIFGAIARWLQQNPRPADMLVGVVLPTLVLATLELCGRSTSPGWISVMAKRAPDLEVSSYEASAFTLRAAGWTLLGSGLLLGGLIVVDRSDSLILGIFSAVLAALGIASFWFAHKLSANITPQPHGQPEIDAAGCEQPLSPSWIGDGRLNAQAGE
jgi:Na+/proline symporter